MNANHFPLLGILRGSTPDMLEPLAEVFRRTSLGMVEVTLNTVGAMEQISELVRLSQSGSSCLDSIPRNSDAGSRDSDTKSGNSGHSFLVGAGTVLDLPGARRAHAAGAGFLVSPCLVQEVAAYARDNDLPYYPGALTPAEVWQAWSAGATMVKVFPAGVMGPGYFKDLKGPFDGVKLLACGGVNPRNAIEYKRCGADAAAFGSGVFQNSLMQSGDWNQISRNIEHLQNAFDDA